MGGRGASSGRELSRRRDRDNPIPVPYGSTYESVAQFGKYKVIIGIPESNGKYLDTPQESQTPNRVYVYLKQNEDFSSMVHIGKDGKRYKQIDMPHHGEKGIHVHYGYNHNEYSADNKPRKPTKKRT